MAEGARSYEASLNTIRAGAGDPRPMLLAAPMSAAQRIGVVTTLLITAADGFDILAASFAAPGISAEWKITHASLGLILGMNLIGLGLGALLVSPLADRIGRRRTILPCILLVSAAMFLSCLAHAPAMLGATRLLAGLGIGGMAGPTLSLAAEYSNVRNRPLSTAVISIGLPLGGMIGGAMASWLLKDHDWRSIFLAGGVVTLGIAALAMRTLPESVDYLMSRRDERSMHALNAVLRRFGQPALDAFPVSPEVSAPGERPARGAIFGRELRGTTIAMLVINVTQMMTIFYYLNWLPQMVADMKFSASAAAGVSIYQNLFGIAGALLVGLLGRRWPIVALAVVAFLGTAATIILFALLPPDLTLLKLGAGLEGFMALGSSAAIYGVMARAFPAASRSTGVGLSYAFGRVGSVTAALVPGLLFTAGWSFVAVAVLMAAGSVAATFTLLLWHGRTVPAFRQEPVPSLG